MTKKFVLVSSSGEWYAMLDYKADALALARLHPFLHVEMWLFVLNRQGIHDCVHKARVS